MGQLLIALSISCELPAYQKLTFKGVSAFFLAGAVSERTRFGLNRPAADMEGNGEFDFG